MIRCSWCNRVVAEVVAEEVAVCGAGVILTFRVGFSENRVDEVTLEQGCGIFEVAFVKEPVLTVCLVCYGFLENVGGVIVGAFHAVTNLPLKVAFRVSSN